MLFAKKPRIQVLDLGCHLVKALVVEPAADGRLAVVAAETVPLEEPLADPEAALAAADACIDRLARQVLQRGVAVHVLGSEALVRGEIAALAGVPEVALADVMLTDRARFLRSFGTRQRAFASSVRLKLARSGEAVDVTVAHAFARWVDLEHLHHALARNGLALGTVLPRAVAMRELARACAPAGPVILADAGFAATSLLRFAETEPRRWSVAFTGGVDFFREIAGQLQREQGLDGATFLAVMQRAGFEPDAAKLAAAGLSEAEARGVAAGLASREQAYFASLKVACQAIAPAPVPRVAFTGGLALAPGFLERARAALGANTDVLDVAGALDWGKAAPSPGFAACAGAARLVATPGAATGDVAREYVELVSAQDAAAAHYTPLNRRFARAAGAVALALVATSGLWSQRLSSRAEALAAQIQEERRKLEPPIAMKELLGRLRDVRVKEAQADARVQYVGRLLVPRLDWVAIANAIGALTTPRALVLTETTFDVRWPDTEAASEPRARMGRDLLVEPDADAKRGGGDAKQVEVKLAGETDSLETFKKFVGELEAKKLLTDVSYDTSARMAEGRAHGIEHHAHFSFTVTGYLDLSKHAEP